MGTGSRHYWLGAQVCVLSDKAEPGKAGWFGAHPIYRGEREGDWAEDRLFPVGRGTYTGCLADCSSSFISLMELQNWDNTIKSKSNQSVVCVLNFQGLLLR